MQRDTVSTLYPVYFSMINLIFDSFIIFYTAIVFFNHHSRFCFIIFVAEQYALKMFVRDLSKEYFMLFVYVFLDSEGLSFIVLWLLLDYWLRRHLRRFSYALFIFLTWISNTSILCLFLSQSQPILYAFNNQALSGRLAMRQMRVLDGISNVKNHSKACTCVTLSLHLFVWCNLQQLWTELA